MEGGSRQYQMNMERMSLPLNAGNGSLPPPSCMVERASVVREEVTRPSFAWGLGA